MAASLTSTSPAEISALLAGPAGKPPPGVVPNFVDPYMLNPYIWLALGLWISISTLAIAARLGTNLVFDGKLVSEDYVIVLSWVGEFTCSILVAKAGFGAHIWDIRLRNLVRARYYANFNSIIYGPTVLLIKLAILMQYMRIFAPRRRADKSLLYGCWFWIIAVIVFYLVDTTLEIAQCLPREKIWNPFFQGGSCIDYVSLYKATGLFNILSDFGLLLLPLPIIITLQCSWKRKLQIGGVFAIGFLRCIASTFRTVYIWKLMHTTDISFYTWYVAFWTYTEICIGTLVFCLPGMPRFFQVARNRMHAISVNYLLSLRRGSRESGISGRAEEEQRRQQHQEGELPVKKADVKFPHMFVSYASWEDPNASHLRSMGDLDINQSAIANGVELQTIEEAHVRDTLSPSQWFSHHNQSTHRNG